MRVVLVIVVVVAWIVILVPGFIKRRSAGGETYSISHFHRQLRVLEHSALNPIVAPAYRLRGADHSTGTDGEGWGTPPVLTVVGARDLPKAALAFLADDPGEGIEPELARSPLVSPGLEVPIDRQSASGDPRIRADRTTRRQARQRRRDTLSVLVLALVTSLLIGFVPGASLAWVASAVLGVALGAYVSLLVHLRRLAEERDRKLHFLRPSVPVAGDGLVSIEEPDEGGLAGVFAAR